MDDFDPAIFGAPHQPDEPEPSIWPALTLEQQSTILMRGEHIATDGTTELLLYRSRYYIRSGPTITLWDGRTYPTK